MNQQDVLEAACDQLDLMVPEILHTEGFRWTITEPDKEFYKQTLRLERILQELTKRPIDLRFEAQADKNKRAGRNGRE